MIYNIHIDFTDLILALLGKDGLKDTQIASSPCTRLSQHKLYKG